MDTARRSSHKPESFEQVADSLVKDLTTTRCDERRNTWLAGLRAAARIEMVATGAPQK